MVRQQANERHTIRYIRNPFHHPHLLRSNWMQRLEFLYFVGSLEPFFCACTISRLFAFCRIAFMHKRNLNWVFWWTVNLVEISKRRIQRCIIKYVVNEYTPILSYIYNLHIDFVLLTLYTVYITYWMAGIVRILCNMLKRWTLLAIMKLFWGQKNSVNAEIHHQPDTYQTTLSLLFSAYFITLGKLFGDKKRAKSIKSFEKKNKLTKKSSREYRKVYCTHLLWQPKHEKNIDKCSYLDTIYRYVLCI